MAVEQLNGRNVEKYNCWKIQSSKYQSQNTHVKKGQK